jgi:hypothetical protein
MGSPIGPLRPLAERVLEGEVPIPHVREDRGEIGELPVPSGGRQVAHHPPPSGTVGGPHLVPGSRGHGAEDRNAVIGLAGLLVRAVRPVHLALLNL